MKINNLISIRDSRFEIRNSKYEIQYKREFNIKENSI